MPSLPVLYLSQQLYLLSLKLLPLYLPKSVCCGTHTHTHSPTSPAALLCPCSQDLQDEVARETGELQRLQTQRQEVQDALEELEQQKSSLEEQLAHIRQQTSHENQLVDHVLTQNQ